MTGPRPAGPPWTPDDDRKLMAMIEAGMAVRMVMTFTSRLGKIRKRERQTEMASSVGDDDEQEKT